MAYVQQNRTYVEETGIKANVPNNDIAKLMYYFKCVCTTIQCGMTPQMRRLTNYQYWMRLSDFDIRQLISLCYVFSPDVFNNRVFFQDNVLCGAFTNNFYSINQVTNQIHGRPIYPRGWSTSAS